MRMKAFRPDLDVVIGGADLDELINAVGSGKTVPEALDAIEFSHPTAFPPAGTDVSHVVTFLVDQSGSQRGGPSQHALIVLDEAARHLEEQGIAFEVIGHTTPDWKGGKTFQAYKEAGKPYPDPKTFWRLNETLVMVHKSVGESWADVGRERFANTAIDLMRFHHENFDQVALLEAVQRFDDIDAGKRSVVMIGDLCPTDEATKSQGVGNGDIAADFARTIEEVAARGVRMVGISIPQNSERNRKEADEREGVLKIPVMVLPPYLPWAGQTQEHHEANVRDFVGTSLSDAIGVPWNPALPLTLT